MKNITDVDKNLEMKTVNKDDLKAYHVRDKCFTIYGSYVPESDTLFRRVPEEVAKNMSDGAHFQHTNTAGIRVRFKTDSQYIALKPTMALVSFMPIMPLAGSTGFDIYADGKFVGIIAPPVVYKDKYRATVETSNTYEGIVEFPDRKMREIQINFPLYSDVSDLSIGLQEDAKIESGAKYTHKKPIVFYGSSITQGAAASRPGNSYEAIISRRFDTDYINLGFSGNARAEDAIAEYISNLNMSIFVYDYDHNAPTVEHLQKTHKPMFDKIRAKHPDLPIIMLTRPNRTEPSEREARVQIIKDTYNTAKASGDNNVYFIDGADILNLHDPEMVTVDNCHPNDFGFYCMAEMIGSIIEKLLK